MQCSRYDSVLYDGKQHTWLPYVSSELNACELFCLSEREKFYASRNPRVVDGTACGDSGVCVEGACRVGRRIEKGRLLFEFFFFHFRQLDVTGFLIPIDVSTNAACAVATIRRALLYRINSPTQTFA